MVLTLGRRPRRVAPPSHHFPAPLLRPQEPLFHGTLSIFGAAALLLCGAVARADRPVDLVTVDEHLIASIPVQVFRAPKVEAAPVPVKPDRRQRRAHGSASAASTAMADPSSAPRTTTLSVLGTHGLSNEGWTPLLYACWFGHDLVADYLIGQGADTEAATQGKNCMEWATSKGHAKCVEALQASIERAKCL